MTDVYEIHRWLEKQSARPLYKDEGVMFGDPSRPVTGVTVCWMPSPANIHAAAAAGHDLLIHHEALLYPYPFDHNQPLSAMHWRTNGQRLAALAQTGLIATRLHATLDQLFIFDTFAEQLGLKRVVAQGTEYHHRVFEIEPTAYVDLIQQVKKATGLKDLRVTGVRRDRLVRRVGMPWGGLGLFVNVSYVQSLIELIPAIDVMVVGETDNYGFRFCTEIGIDVIETSHEVSENQGLGRFAQALKKKFPSLDVRHIADPCVWMAR